MNPNDRLLHTEAIKLLKAQYFRSVDMQDWVAFAAVFTANATLEVDRPNGTAKILGRTAIVSWVSGFLKGARSIHHGHMPEIHLSDVDTASGIWSMEDRLSWPDRQYHGFGHYHEQYVREHDRWHIKYCRLVRIDLRQGLERE